MSPPAWTRSSRANHRKPKRKQTTHKPEAPVKGPAAVQRSMSSDVDNHRHAQELAPPEQNPYASPAEAGGYDSQVTAGIGVWCDGKHFVLHRDAAFPPICLKTGEPATRYRKYGLLWS